MKKKTLKAFEKNTVPTTQLPALKGGNDDSFIEDDCTWNPTHEFPAGEADSNKGG